MEPSEGSHGPLLPPDCLELYPGVAQERVAAADAPGKRPWVAVDRGDIAVAETAIQAGVHGA